MQQINGKKIADQILKSISHKESKTKLAVILIGKNPASRLYVKIKEEKAKKIGINFEKHLLSTDSKQKCIIELIQKLNTDKSVSAILVQLPLPKHLNTHKIIKTIHPNKDADGIHPKHLKLLKQGKLPPILPATTGAILEAIKSTKINLKNKSVAIIGKSTIVGLPTYYYLKNKVKKINIYDSSTKNLKNKTSQADILIVAIGQPKYITEEYIKQNAIVIDVGINKVGNKTIGDVDQNSVAKKASYLTPVPGGIGPLTVSILLQNTIKLNSSPIL